MADLFSLGTDDVRAAYRLIHELCELGNDPLEWNTHLLGTLEALLDGDWGSTYVIRPDFDPSKIEFTFALHHNADENWTRYIDKRDLTDQPVTPAIMSRLGTDFTMTRQELIDDATWYASSFYERVARPSNWDQMLCSQVMLHTTGVIHGMGIVRAIGKPAFDDHDRALMRFVHAELAHLWNRPDAVAIDALPKRLMETVSGMRRGLSRKEIAAELGVSPHTIHSHEKQVFRRFGVSGRGELLAKMARIIRPSLPK
jgi:hypothetical protein